TAAETVGGPALGAAMAAGGLASNACLLMVTILGQSRLPMVLAADGLFPPVVARTHPPLRPPLAPLLPGGAVPPPPRPGALRRLLLARPRPRLPADLRHALPPARPRRERDGARLPDPPRLPRARGDGGPGGRARDRAPRAGPLARWRVRHAAGARRPRDLRLGAPHLCVLPPTRRARGRARPVPGRGRTQ